MTKGKTKSCSESTLRPENYTARVNVTGSNIQFEYEILAQPPVIIPQQQLRNYYLRNPRMRTVLHRLRPDIPNVGRIYSVPPRGIFVNIYDYFSRKTVYYKRSTTITGMIN